MLAAGKFAVEYVSPSIVRCEPNEFALVYKDERGEVTFSGFERGHRSGGMLYFPTVIEWSSSLPARRGQRELVLECLTSFVRGDRRFSYLESSLVEPAFFVRWPKEREYLRRPYARGTPMPTTTAEIMSHGKTFFQRFKRVEIGCPPPGVPRAQFDGDFRCEIIGDSSGFGTLKLRSDRESIRPTRVELKFVLAQCQQVPATFSGLTVDDFTYDDATRQQLEPQLSRLPNLRIFRLRGHDGTTSHVVATLCILGEENVPPDAPTIFPDD